ncbi:CaiB/BaiF CoA-transferase family protein [Roseomonas sp. KE0001]|uniref:CaiB/BaiF CoA transferase family protein n=1 Tax=Roseomonas sp. KE0001 TaxID=2479201 RepID=UPI001E463023|nr:CoA transferase [Roseomonas sp. KE0001]MBI0436118.1 CoA transferase [Roseomonas sp. KE0001]
MSTAVPRPQNDPPRTGPLAGLRVVELSMYVAAPVCGLLLGDLGAEVIKVERLPEGDDVRQMSPPEMRGEAASFLVLNRGKRGVAIDAKQPDGLRALKRLCAGADVLIENFRPGTLERLGLGYEALRAENPGLIYASVSGFGLTGPEAQRPGLDLIAQAFTGLMSITGEGPGRPPVKVGAPVTDTTAGMLLALGVVAAHAHKLRTGQGQRVETSLIEAGIMHTVLQSAMTLATGVSPGPLGSAHPLGAPYQAFACADGWIVIGAQSDGLFRRAMRALDEEAGIGADPHWATSALRIADRPALIAALEPVFARLTRADCLARLDAAGVPCGPVHSVGEMLEHPQTRARNMVVEVAHPDGGAPVPALGCPLKFSATPAVPRGPAPRLGEDTAAVLREAGLDTATLERLREQGIIRMPEAVA